MIKHKKSTQNNTVNYPDKKLTKISIQKRNAEDRNKSQAKKSGSGFGPNGQIWFNFLFQTKTLVY